MRIESTPEVLYTRDILCIATCDKEGTPTKAQREIFIETFSFSPETRSLRSRIILRSVVIFKYLFFVS